MPAVRLERMAHADKDVGLLLARQYGTGLPAVLDRDRSCPREYLIRVVVDLGNTEAERGALGERPLVAEVPHLGPGLVVAGGLGRVCASAGELLGLGVRRADLAWPHGNR